MFVSPHAPGKALGDELAAIITKAGTTYKVVKCVKYINATTGVFSINDPIS